LHLDGEIFVDGKQENRKQRGHRESEIKDDPRVAEIVLVGPVTRQVLDCGKGHHAGQHHDVRRRQRANEPTGRVSQPLVGPDGDQNHGIAQNAHAGHDT